MNQTSAATGLSHGHRAEPQHATRAVRQAMQRAGVEGQPEFWFTEDVEDKSY